MSSTFGVGVAIAAGAALMYSFDPAHGRRRRARVRNEVDHLMHVVPRSLRKAGVDGAQRVRGQLTHLRPVPSAEVDDDVLGGRIRASLGRCCSHPSSVAVSTCSGVVELRGRVADDEADTVIRHIRRVPGVLVVKDGLERQGASESPSSAGHRPRGRPGLLRRRWPLSVRWGLGAGAFGLIASGLMRGGLRGKGLALLGSATLLRAATNRPLMGVLGLGDEPDSGIEVTKTMTIHAPASDVFAQFVAFENFPNFMRHVRGVRRIGDNRWHWTVQGTAGLSFDWDGIVTQQTPPSRIAWTSAETAVIRHHGEACFEALSDRTTRLTVRLVYHPPLGALGHAIARLMGSDPRREINDDLVRFKSLLERRKTAGDNGSITPADRSSSES